MSTTDYVFVLYLIHHERAGRQKQAPPRVFFSINTKTAIFIFHNKVTTDFVELLVCSVIKYMKTFAFNVLILYSFQIISGNVSLHALIVQAYLN